MLPLAELFQFLFPLSVPVGSRRVIVIYGAYYDESEVGTSFSLAGFSAAYDTWVHLDWAWADLLKKWKLEYFKASECENLLEQFAQYRDNPEDQKSPLKPNERARMKQIKTDFIDAICKHRDDLQGYGAVVIMKDFERIISESSEALRVFSDKPYYICFQLCMLAAAYPAREDNQRRPYSDRIRIKPIFDSHKEYSKQAKELFDGFVSKNPKSAEVLLPPDYEDDVETSALQVADSLAYEARKCLARQIHDPEDGYVRPPLVRLLPSVYRMYKLDHAALELIIKRQKPDSIPLLDVKIDDLVVGWRDDEEEQETPRGNA